MGQSPMENKMETPRKSSNRSLAGFEKHLKSLIPVERIHRRIYLIRGHKVMLDKDLAVLYGVKPIALRQQVRRNLERFPEDFMFPLTGEEVRLLLSQNVIPSKKYLAHSYLEQ